MFLYSLYLRKEAGYVAGYSKSPKGALILQGIWPQGPSQPTRRNKRVTLNCWPYAAKWMKPSKRVLYEAHRPGL